MSSKGFNLLKALACLVLVIVCLIIKIRTPEENWTYAGIIAGGLATIGFLKRAFDKY